VRTGLQTRPAGEQAGYAGAMAYGVLSVGRARPSDGRWRAVLTKAGPWFACPSKSMRH